MTKYTPTGRIARSVPQFQNIPVRTPEGTAIKEAFMGGHSIEAKRIEARLDQAVRDGKDLEAIKHARALAILLGAPDALVGKNALVILVQSVERILKT